jgi:hypothetical protein
VRHERGLRERSLLGGCLRRLVKVIAFERFGNRSMVAAASLIWVAPETRIRSEIYQSDSVTCTFASCGDSKVGGSSISCLLEAEEARVRNEINQSKMCQRLLRRFASRGTCAAQVVHR